ncbi:hypothetical protein HFP89_00575 [Wenzhouxiangella sp. XN79A]|uniref:hypothetical protein n=1 Tax=Wenzhouxiangella sp. XN79A TaxID=2724193 RepID=UPI00144A7F44|nr:hypothetical protein [Wenzhouxiangella sp. XN79A]NKI33658.1 hypothetical protein [Wenzhouxiangella sp. XN79A]
MFDDTTNHEDLDMDLNSIDAANLDALMAEEAILDWLVDLEAEDADLEASASDESSALYN